MSQDQTTPAPLADPTAPHITDGAVDWRIPPGIYDDATGIDFFVDWPLAQEHAFTRTVDGGWEFHLTRPAAHRLEYQLVIHRVGGDEFTTDPTNPATVTGPFGDKSEIRFPDYREPEWLSTEIRGTRTPIADPSGPLDQPVPITLFTPTDLSDTTPAPLLVAHDGSDLADRGGLLRWACAQPQPLRVLLLDPPSGTRDTWYGANIDYAAHIATSVLPSVQVATSTTIGLGVSLGAVAMMTIHRQHPDSFDALALQSGSFFTPELDPQESRWSRFAEVCTAVAAFTSALPPQVRAIPVLMTVGAIEENRDNNEQMAGALSFQGYPVEARIVPDAHTMVGWRDAWSPGLDRLLAPFLIDQHRT